MQCSESVVREVVVAVDVLKFVCADFKINVMFVLSKVQIAKKECFARERKFQIAHSYLFLVRGPPSYLVLFLHHRYTTN